MGCLFVATVAAIELHSTTGKVEMTPRWVTCSPGYGHIGRYVIYVSAY